MEFFKKIFSKSETAQSAGTLPWVNELKGLDDISVIELVTQRLNTDL